MDFESIALTTRPRLQECQLPNEANAGCYISSCGGGFFDADPGNAQHCKFPRSLTSVSLSSLFWAWNRLHVGTSHDFARLLLFAAGQLSWLQEGSTWPQRALDTNPAVGWGGKKQSHVPAARQQNAVLTRIQTRFATATMQRTNHYTTTGNHWLTARNMANGGLGRCREGAKNLAMDE